MALARVKTIRYGRVASKIGMHPDTLRDFAEGRRATLPAEKLTALALELLGGHTAYDVATGMLKSTSTAPARSYIVPDAPTPTNYNPVEAAQGPRLSLAAGRRRRRWRNGRDG